MQKAETVTNNAPTAEDLSDAPVAHSASNTDPDDNIPLSELKHKGVTASQLSASPETPVPSKKMEFVSKTVGIVKRKHKHSFKCNKCNDR